LDLKGRKMDHGESCIINFTACILHHRRMRWVGHVACMGERRGVYRVLVGRPTSKRPVGRCRCRWEDNIKLYLREMGINGVNWIQLA
jgi:hypothetical protein